MSRFLESFCQALGKIIPLQLNEKWNFSDKVKNKNKLKTKMKYSNFLINSKFANTVWRLLEDFYSKQKKKNINV